MNKVNCLKRTIANSVGSERKLTGILSSPSINKASSSSLKHERKNDRISFSFESIAPKVDAIYALMGVL